MKRRDLERMIAIRASHRGGVWDLLRSAGGHDIWSLDGIRIPIPRHNEINEYTAQGILKATESKLGEGWWR
jgi:hypothetical protein